MDKPMTSYFSNYMNAIPLSLPLYDDIKIIIVEKGRGFFRGVGGALAWRWQHPNVIFVGWASMSAASFITASCNNAVIIVAACMRSFRAVCRLLNHGIL